jgi:hypothetical protein
MSQTNLNATQADFNSNTFFGIDFRSRCITLFVYLTSYHALQVPIMWQKLPIGVKFDPTDLELLQHLEEKCNLTNVVSSVLTNDFIPTIQQRDGICYTHPENLPGTYGSRFLTDRCF